MIIFSKKITLWKFLRKVKWTPELYNKIMDVLKVSLNCDNCPIKKECWGLNGNCHKVLSDKIKIPKMGRKQ